MAHDNLCSPDIELAFLAGAVCNPGVFEKLAPSFTADVFSMEDHGLIFEAAKVAAETGAKHICPAVELALPHLAGRGGYIRQLLTAVISGKEQDILSYAKLLEGLAERRMLVRSLADAMAALKEPLGSGPPTPAVVATLLNDLDGIVTSQRTVMKAVSLGTAMQAALEAGERAFARGDGLTGLTTGFYCLNRFTRGLVGGNLYILAGRPGMAKSALAVQICIRAARAAAEEEDGGGVLFISLEMGADQIGQRALSLLAGVDLEDVVSGAFMGAQWKCDRMMRARMEAAKLPLDIEEEPQLTIAAIRQRVKNAMRRHGKIRLVVIDHMQIMGKSPTAAKFGPVAAMTELSGGCKALAKEFGVPVIALSQLSRKVEERENKRPNLSDLRESGSIEQDADAVMFLYRQAYYDRKEAERKWEGESNEDWQARMDEFNRTSGPEDAEIIFEKNRQGKPGTARMLFRPQMARFEEDGTQDGPRGRDLAA